MWGSQSYALDFRQVGGNTHNNTVRNNFLFGTVRFDSSSADSDFAGNLVAACFGNAIDNANITATAPNSYGFRGEGTQEWPTIWARDPAYVLAPPTGMTAFIRSFVKSMDFADSPVYSKPRTLTSSGATINAQDVDIISSCSVDNTIALPAPQQSLGRALYINTTTAHAVTSSIANVVPVGGGAPGYPILAATAGKNCRIVSDGTNWIITQAN